MNTLPDTPLLNELETGPWPSFVTGLKRLAEDNPYVRMDGWDEEAAKWFERKALRKTESMRTAAHFLRNGCVLSLG